MESGVEEIGEKDILEVGYDAVIDSLAGTLSKDSGRYYCLTDGMYMRGTVLEGTILQETIRGIIQKGKRYEFIQDRLAEGDCIGFIPLTPEVVPDLESLRLRRIYGRRNPFTNLRVDLYTRQA